MLKITNDDLTRSDTGCFIAVRQYGNSWRQWVNELAVMSGMCCKLQALRKSSQEAELSQIHGVALALEYWTLTYYLAPYEHRIRHG